MKAAYTYILTCVICPFFWDTPTAVPEYQRPADFGPDANEYPYRCDCYSVEPDMECALWAAENCEIHPAND